jgi:hypothetical protein
MNPSNRVITGILRRALKRGRTVDIDGLGSFRQAKDGGYEFLPQLKPRVFVAYVIEDLRPVRRLCDALRSAGFSPWLDREELLPGQNWPRSIERAIEIADVFVACFSPRSIGKRGTFQSELRYALHCARQVPLDSSFLIPVRLESCVVPRRIANHVEYVDLFPDWERGVKRVLRAIRTSVRRSVILPRIEVDR